MRRAELTALLIWGFACPFTTATRAQQAEALLEEVLVTAQKKFTAESAQTVPISMAAYSGTQVEAMFAISLTDVGLSTPNVNLTAIPTFPGVANFVIRGMGTVGQSIPSADPAVGVFVDGVALGTIYGVVTDLFDLESIEILRGPQGTLFGRNVTGGAVLLRSKRPTDEFEGSVRATVGSYSQRDIALILSGPISDNWGAKIAVLRKDHGDYWDNRSLGVSQGDSQTLLVRPALSFERGGFDATAIFEYGKMEGDGLGAITWWADGAPVLDPYADRVSLQDTIGYSDLEWMSGSIEANWDLWEGQLTAVLGLRDLEQGMESDIDGYSGDRFEFARGTRLDQDQQSIELRWSGDLGEKVTLTTGLYGFQQEYTYGERRFLNRAVDRRGVSTIAHDTQSVFAQADWRLLEKFTLTIGGRYTREQKDAEIGVIGDPRATGDCATAPPPFSPATPALSDCVPALVDNKNWSNFGPKIGANWAITDDVMIYADYSRGFRSGGYNVRFTDLTYVTNPARPLSTPGPYNEEVVDAVEIGIKSTLFDGKARVNAGMFQNQYDDLQRTALNAAGGQEILNAASARIQGFELEATMAVTREFVLQAGLGLIDAEYEDFQTAEAATGLPADKLRFVLVPDVKYNVAATYDWRTGQSSVLTGRLAYSFVDETFSDDFNRARQDDYGLWDASLTFESDNGLKVSLFGKNIIDEVYYDFGTDFSTSALSVRSFWLTPPRTYGVEATYSF